MDQQLKDISTEVDSLTTFVLQNMITKTEFEERLNDLPTKEDFHQLQTSVDGIASEDYL